MKTKPPHKGHKNYYERGDGKSVGRDEAVATRRKGKRVPEKSERCGKKKGG